jgi:predicted ATP-grasp superfamily ATP-dependent carboligase
MSNVEIIITDGMWRKSLSVVRALGKMGFDITVFGDSIFTICFWSKYTSRRIYAHSASDSPEHFGHKLITHLSSRPGNVKVLIPMEDESMMWASSNRERLKEYCSFLLPPHESLLIAQNKSKCLNYANQLGLPIPLTFSYHSFDQFLEKIRELKAQNKLNDFIVKPVSGRGSLGISYFPESNNLDWSVQWKNFGPLLIQQRIRSGGDAVGVSLLYDKNSNCIAEFVHKRLHEYPISGGPSTSRIGVLNEDLLNKSKILLEKLNWVGVAMVEWKYDSQSKLPYLMEINPRFWGSLELAVRSGINFPEGYVSGALSRLCTVQNKYSLDLKCRWVIPGDILRFFSQGKSRESIMKFMKGLPEESEEWDRSDLMGTISVIFCTFAAVFKVKYWKFLFR